MEEFFTPKPNDVYVGEIFSAEFKVSGPDEQDLSTGLWLEMDGFGFFVVCESAMRLPANPEQYRKEEVLVRWHTESLSEYLMRYAPRRPLIMRMLRDRLSGDTKEHNASAPLG